MEIHDQTFVNQCSSFGELLKHLRRQNRMTQRDLAIATGYSEGQICRLEVNQRLPDIAALTALFVPALNLQTQPEAIARLIELASVARNEPIKQTSVRIETTMQITTDEANLQESIPSRISTWVARPELTQRIRQELDHGQSVVLYGLAGNGKTSLMSDLAQNYPLVFWFTFHEHTSNYLDVFIYQLALFISTYSSDDLKNLVLAPNTVPFSLEQQLRLLTNGLKTLIKEQKTLLLCLDNIHCIQHDPVVLQVIQQLIQTTTAVFLMTSRELITIPQTTPIAVRGLADYEILQLINQLEPNLPKQTLDTLQKRSDGNPMLLRLLLGILRDQQQIESLHGIDTVLHQAIERLSPSAWLVLGLLAVANTSINLHDEFIIEQLQKLEPTLDIAAASRELVRRCIINNSQHASVHPLLQEYVYSELANNLAQRRTLHRIAAEWFELVVNDLLQASYHYTKASAIEQVADALIDQGLNLFSQGLSEPTVTVIDEAFQILRRNRSSLPAIERTLYQTRGDLLVHTVRASESDGDYQAALERADNPQVRAHIGWRMVQRQINRGVMQSAIELTDQLLNQLEADDTHLYLRLASLKAVALHSSGNTDQAFELAQQLFSIIDQIAWRDSQAILMIRAQLYNLVGIIYHLRHKPNQALEAWQMVANIAQKAGLRMLEYRVAGNIGILALNAGNYDLAEQYLRQASEGLRRIGDSYSLGKVLHNLAIVCELQTRWDEALHTCQEALQLKHETNDDAGLMLSQAMLMHHLVLRGYSHPQLLEQIETFTPITDETLRSHLALQWSQAEILVLTNQSVQAQTIIRQLPHDPATASENENRLAIALLPHDFSQALNLIALDIDEIATQTDRLALRVLATCAARDWQTATQALQTFSTYTSQQYVMPLYQLIVPRLQHLIEHRISHFNPVEVLWYGLVGD